MRARGSLTRRAAWRLAALVAAALCPLPSTIRLLAGSPGPVGTSEFPGDISETGPGSDSGFEFPLFFDFLPYRTPGAPGTAFEQDRPILEFLPGDVPQYLARPFLFTPEQIHFNLGDFGEINSDGSFDHDGNYDSIRLTTTRAGDIVDFRVRSGFDYDQNYVSLQTRAELFELWDYEPSHRTRLRYAGFLDSKNELAIFLEASTQLRHYGTENRESQWGIREAEGESITFLDEFDIRHTPVRRHRDALQLNLDWRPNEQTSAYLRAVWRTRDDEERSQRLKYDTDLDARDPYPYDPATDVIQGGVAVDATIRDADGRMERKLKEETETESIAGFQAGFDHLFDDGSRLKLDGTWAREVRTEPDRFDIEYRLDDFGDPLAPGYRYILRDPQNPRIINNPENSNRVRIDDPHAFLFDHLEHEDNRKADSFGLAAAEYSHPASLLGLPAEVRTGVQFHHRGKLRDIDYRRFQAIEGRVFRMDEVASGWLPSSGGYHFGPLISPRLARRFFQDNAGSGLEPMENESEFGSFAEDYDVDEHIAAPFAGASVSDNWWKLDAGVRFEHSEGSHDGWFVNWDGKEPLFNRRGELVEGLVVRDRVSESTRHSALLPGVRFDWSPQNQTRFTAAWTTALWRPRLRDLSPGFSATADLNRFGNPEEPEIFSGDPGLDPSRITSFDLRLDHFLGPIGLLSLHAFHRRVEDPLLLTAFTAPFADTFGTVHDYLYHLPVNAEDGRIDGFRFDFARQFTELPDPADGFGAFVSYTWMDSAQDAVIHGRERSLPLAETPEHTLRTGFFYSKDSIYLRLAWVFQSEMLLSAGEDPLGVRGGGDLRIDDYGQLELRLDFQVNRYLELFVEARNLTDETRSLYEGRRLRSIEERDYGRSYRIGFHASF